MEPHLTSRTCSEKKWVTQCGFFRLYTTFLGMNVSDVYGLMPFVLNQKPESILSIADEISAEMIETAEKSEIKRGRIRKKYLPEVFCQNVTTSTISSPTIHNSQHTQCYLKGGRQIRCVWCSRVNFTERKTTLLCVECDRGYCRDSSGRGCWSHHVANGGCPVAPERGSIQESIKRRKQQDDED